MAESLADKVSCRDFFPATLAEMLNRFEKYLNMLNKGEMPNRVRIVFE